MPSTAILWFRRDLRRQDNPALMLAVADYEQLIPVYLHSPGEEAPWQPGSASNWWLHHSLSALDSDLQSAGSRLLLLRGPSLECLRRLIAVSGATAVFWNRVYEPASIARDTLIKTQLRADGIRCQSANAALWFEPWQIQTSANQPFKVFSPFWRRYEARLSDVAAPLQAPDRLPPIPDSVTKDAPSALPTIPLAALGFLPRIPWDSEFPAQWTPGATGAANQFKTFVEGPATNYAQGRDLPAEFGTSRLSPHLHFGEIGPRQLLSSLPPSNPNAAAYLRELGWREFNIQLLYHFPHGAAEPLNAIFNDFPWADPAPPNLLAAWQQGQTGIPLVDAGMRELWRTGWMHNRVRMIVASFLTKNLRIHWQAGARWFWDTLVDADLANNSMGWQWTAGCGADAAPYFRVFNPIRQGERFDPDGAYVRRWCPELARLPQRYLHQPWTAPVAVLQQAGVRLGSNYPLPIADLSKSRQQALAFWRQLRDSDTRTELA